MVKYIQIKFPPGLIESIENYRKNHPEYGFRNRSEIIISLIRGFVKHTTEHTERMAHFQALYEKRKKTGSRKGIKLGPPVDFTNDNKWFG